MILHHFSRRDQRNTPRGSTFYIFPWAGRNKWQLKTRFYTKNMIFSDFRRPAASTPPFCMIFCGANDGTHRVKHAQPPGRQPIQIHTPPTSTTIATPTAHDTGRSLFSIKQRLTDSLVEQIPNTTCSEENLYEKFCLPQTLCPNSQYRRRLAFCIFAWKGRKTNDN